MSLYTIELRKMINDPDFNLFDFDYKFYSDNEADKKEFEEMFINHYYFHEIAFETGSRFKHQLRAKLNLNARKYEQLYYSELKSKDIEFLLNKDLVEEFTKTLDRTSSEKTTANNQSNANTTSDSKVSSKNENEVSESNLNNGISSADATKRKTSHSKINDTETSTSKNQSKSNQSINTDAQTDNDEQATETTRLVSRGNIGTTSSAQLLRDWRDVMINLNEMIIDDCRDLFLYIY